MIPAVICFIKGYVKVRIEGNSPERFINLCSFHHMCIWKISPCGGKYEFYMTVEELKRIRPIARKTHTRLKVLKRRGLPFFIYKNRNRKVFFGGIILCLLLVRMFSGILWDVHFDGNSAVSSETLNSFLAGRGIRAPMPLCEVDCSRIEEELREKFDEIVWVSASLDGSRLTINTKEDDGTFACENKPARPVDLVASKDGIITGMITRRGTPLVHVGDKVSKGDVLVTGRIDITNDSEEIAETYYTAADADIFADTVTEYTDSVKISYGKKIYGGGKLPWQRQNTQFYLKIGPLCLCAGMSGDRFKEKDVMTKKYRLKFGENFFVPVEAGTKVFRAYTLKNTKRTRGELQELLSRNFMIFSKELEEKGIQILENNVKIHIKENSASAEGILKLNEDIKEEAETVIAERNSVDES